MKKNLITILSLFLLSCNAEKQQTITEKCPSVLFSKEHQTYITSDKNPLTIDNISYSAVLNNYLFNQKCFVSNNILTGNISLLFVIKPNNISHEEIFLPFYIAILTSEDEVLDIQYFSAEGVMKKDSETLNYIETELTNTFVIRIPNKDIKTNIKTSMVIGFMLDEEKIKLLN